VKNTIRAENGIEATWNETDDKGESEPILPNPISEGKNWNRRFKLIKL
jgi:hypothetical protein